MLAAENNDKVKELFQGRLGIEKAHQVAEFSIFQFIPKPLKLIQSIGQNLRPQTF